MLNGRSQDFADPEKHVALGSATSEATNEAACANEGSFGVSLLPQTERESRLQDILDSAPIGIVSVNSSGCVISFNREAESIFGFAAGEICGRPLDCLISQDKQRAHANHVKDFIHGPTQSMPMSNWRQVLGVHKDGHTIPLQVVIAKSDVNGERLATAIIRDMSDLAERDERLTRLAAQNAMNAKIAAAASRARREFMALMSHELRTPLNAIIGFSELLLNDRVSRLPETTKAEYVADINTSGKQLLNLINGILELTRIESGKMELKYESIDVSAALTEVAASMAPSIADKNIELVLPSGDLDAVITVDPDGLRQILGHLLSNAIKFSYPCGRVTIALSEIDSGRSVQIAFSDAGIGIPKHQISRLCRPFAQLDSPLVRTNGGVGIGLATSKVLVDAMAGRLEIDSDVGQGTTVTLVFAKANRSRSVECGSNG